MGALLSALLHGTYNTFSDGWIGIGVAALTILAFLSYVRTGDLISKEMARGLEPTEPETILMTG